MELVDFITKLININGPTEAERYWRLIVKCFLVDRLEELQLDSLPHYYEIFYGQRSTLNGKLNALVQEPEFKPICYLTTKQSKLWIRPSNFLLQILRAQFNDLDQQRLKLHPTNGTTNSNIVNNITITNEKSELRQNPFALDAIKELEGTERNSDTKFGRLTSEELTCGICFELLKNAVEGNCCKNLFCASCIEGYGRKCPNCRKVVTWTPNEPIRRLLAKKPIQCDYEDCGMWSTVSEIEQHRVKCEFNPNSLLARCQKCQQRITRNLMEEHLSNACEMNKVPCYTCGKVVVKKDLTEHSTKFCEFRLIPCAHGCGEQMTYKQFNEVHFKSCSHQMVQCSNRNCLVRVQRRLLQEHNRECNYVEIDCPNCAQGCKAKPLRGAVHLHLATCDFQLVKCEHGCDQQILRRDVKKHTCDHMSVKCPDCAQVLKKKDLERHNDTCPAQQIKCPNKCGTSVSKNNLQQHIQSSCSRRKVQCPKCLTSVVAASLAKHTSSSCPQRSVECQLCGDQVIASSIGHHEAKECPMRIVKCEKCADPVNAGDFKRHLSHECKKRSVWCAACKEELTWEAVSSHFGKCIQRTERCGTCHKEFHFAELESHEAICPERPVPCQHCQNRYAANIIARHSEKCPMREVQCPDCKESMPAFTRKMHVCSN